MIIASLGAELFNDAGMLLRLYDFSCQIKEKLVQLTEKRKEMMFKWDERWDWLRLCK